MKRRERLVNAIKIVAAVTDKTLPNKNDAPKIGVLGILSTSGIIEN